MKALILNSLSVSHAQHDPDACQPNGPLGNYIMYPSATSGDKPNNRKFSDCSLEKMSAVVQAVVNEYNGKRNCLAATDEAFCGNKITEEGEVCDCGYNSQECDEKCCYPAVIQDGQCDCRAVSLPTFASRKLRITAANVEKRATSGAAPRREPVLQGEIAPQRNLRRTAPLLFARRARWKRKLVHLMALCNFALRMHAICVCDKRVTGARVCVYHADARA